VKGGFPYLSAVSLAIFQWGLPIYLDLWYGGYDSFNGATRTVELDNLQLAFFLAPFSFIANKYIITLYYIVVVTAILNVL